MLLKLSLCTNPKVHNVWEKTNKTKFNSLTILFKSKKLRIKTCLAFPLWVIFEDDQTVLANEEKFSTKNSHWKILMEW